MKNEEYKEQRMMSLGKKTFFVLLGVLLPLFCGSCVSLVERTGRFLDGSSRAEKNIAVYRTTQKDGTGIGVTELRNKAGDRSVLITLEQFPAIKIRGSSPDEQGEFHLSSLDYLGGSTHGWNEYRLGLSGSGHLVLGETTATLSIPDEIITVDISSGRIRRFDTRITGNEALTSLGNRRERILALTEWMNAVPESENFTTEYGYPADSLEDTEEEEKNILELPGRHQKKPGDLSRDDFEKYWKAVLFPEMVSKKKRPEGWKQDGDSWARAEDIRWNLSYTERVFPEELRNIRNSGTMLRDWEEAFEWIYVEYAWSHITEILSQETVLERRKK
jgi:hypothetical protein